MLCDDPMPTAQDSRVREVSKPLFGNSYRLELLAIIAELDGPFYARQIAARMDVADNLVTLQLARLCELGLLERRSSSPHVLYTRNDSRAWEMAKQLRAEFGGQAADQCDPMPGLLREHVVLPSQADVASLADALRGAPTSAVRHEQPGSATNAYLDARIEKPWGYEYRVYDDVLTDAWAMRLLAGQRTSRHAHPRKNAVLLCLEGSGSLTTSDRSIPLAGQTVVRVAAGAVCRIAAGEVGIRLIEIETPRDKFDHVRLEDDSGRASRAYDGDRWVSHHRLPPLAALTAGPPRARLRRRGETGGYAFAVEAGKAIRTNPSGLTFAISLDLGSILRREFTVLGSSQADLASADVMYLTIRDVISRGDILVAEESAAPVDAPRIRRREGEHERTLYTDGVTASTLARLQAGEGPAELSRSILLYESEMGVIRASAAADTLARDVEVVAVRVREGWGEIEIPAAEGTLVDEVLGLTDPHGEHPRPSPDLTALLSMLAGLNVAISVPGVDVGRTIWAPYPDLLRESIATPG